MALDYKNYEYWWGREWNTDFPTGGTNTMENHIKNTVIHVTQADKDRWNNTKGLEFKIVESLPTTGETGVIYLIKNQSGETGNIYDEYVYITDGEGNPKWEKIGAVSIDISGKQDKLISGTNIKTINNESVLISSSGDPTNITITTAHPFLSSFVTNQGYEAFRNSVIDNGGVGMSYIGGVTIVGEGWPSGFTAGNIAECRVDVIKNAQGNNVLYIEMYSTNIYPNVWGRVTMGDGYESPWISYNANNKADTATTLSGYGITDAYTKSEVDTFVNSKQDELTSGVNIKTINGETILGSGNTNIVTYNPFPSTWTTSGTLEVVVESILSDTSFTKQGMAYLGGIDGACTPWGGGNVECKVEFMLDGLAVLTANSSNIYPYSWSYNTASGDYKWKKYVYQGTNNNGEYLQLGNTTLSENELISLKNLLNK